MKKFGLTLISLLAVVMHQIAAAQPVVVKNIPGNSYGFFEALDYLYFFHNDSLWKSNGAAGGTVFVKDLGGKGIVYSTHPYGQDRYRQKPFAINKAFFFTTENGANVSLWRSNGTSGGTAAIATYNNIKPLGVLNNEFYFGAQSGGTSNLYKVSTGNPVLLKTINLSPYPQLVPSFPSFENFWFISDDHEVVNGLLMFQVMGNSGPELWKTNGTIAGTVKVKGFQTPYNLNQFTNVDGLLYFQFRVSNSQYPGAEDVELWKSNATAAGTERVTSFQLDYDDLNDLTSYQGKLYFIVNSYSRYMFYVTNGTAQGTQLVTDFGPENETHIIGEVNNLLAINTLFESVSGSIYRSNGTIIGTERVSFTTGSNFTIVGNTLLFTDHINHDPGGGPETPEDRNQLWQSDLTSVNTKPVKNIFPGTSFRDSDNLTNVNGALFFTTPDNLQLKLLKYNPLAPSANKAFFTVVNAVTDEDRAWLRKGDTIVVIPGEGINIRFNPVKNPKSVRFFLNGSAFITENTVPFALAGDNSGNYNIWNASKGHYTLIARQYSGTNASGKLIASDTVQFFLDKLPLPPLVNAGPDQTLNSVSATTLSGTAISQEGSISSVFWSLQSSPGGFVSPVITNPNSLSTTVSELILPGTYIFRLTVTSSEGAVNIDEVSVTVSGQAMGSFSLINADTDQSVFNNFQEGHIFYLSHYSTSNFNIVASTIPGTVGSVRFEYDGKVSIENSAPYALYGDVNGNFNPGPLTLGTHIISATPYSGPNATGVKGLTRTVKFQVMISFPPYANAGHDKEIVLPNNSVVLDGDAYDRDGTIQSVQWSFISGPATNFTMSNSNSLNLSLSGFTVPGTYQFRLTVLDNTGLTYSDNVIVDVIASATQAVVSLTLINADNDTDIMTITNGTMIDRTMLPTLNLNVRANTNPATISSVRFQMDGTFNRVESTVPYAMFGDNNGNYNSGNFTLGSHTLTATPYEGASGSGTVGTPLTVNFSVINSAARISNEYAIRSVCYPNPSSDIFHISIPATESVEAMVDIYDNRGKFLTNLFTGAVQMGEDLSISWNVSDQKPGVYLMKVIMGDKVFTEKLVVK
ncbi:PKD domain-containing protein [Sporocytophaga myxococcoides]|nr:T9SS type A sorting domain-containing protein [Sporocytophaga myxococcoides]